VAVSAAESYTRAGGWDDADLGRAAALADAAGAWLVIRDAAGTMVWPGHGMGPSRGPMHTATATGGAAVEAAVTVAGATVGTVRLGFPSGATSGRGVAWSWIAGAALAALGTALVVSAYVSRRLTRPLIRLAGAAHRFAGGDRTARARIAAPGELGAVAHAFDTMADEVVRAEAVRRRLAADVAHELRTPLAALQAGLEELRDGLRPADPARLAALHDQSLRLARVVRDLADLSAAEAAALSMTFADTDLAELARAALAAERPRLDAAGLRIDVDLGVPAPVRADPGRLHQAITNLLANTARYCRPGDHVRITAGVDGGHAVLRVADTGPGIPAGELPHAFDRLWRGHGAREVTGTGIGLAVVREMVTAHGGAAELDSPPGGGLTVTLRLPLRT
jgi:two-component system sensor histidine kinase BaeS